MTLSTGVDIIELDRIHRALERYGDRFLTRLYTPEEIARYGKRLPELAARFAAKEAVSKALGVGINHMSAHGIGWREVEVLPDPLGKPVVRLTGRARQLAQEQGLRQWAISLSHGRDYAVAFVVASD
jgi:holo-[acyl-carrier protein] synthase